ncbi:hypothetical protein B7P43_G14671 [Cryptotermes secundus]|uniref:Uncharacterized protein n=1 Tax=Cryptotermes secundus TaxID=105785 RepID=A0A2J7PFS4_9NEOP|nr:hypothetical protein B7P43_G14671 [Cryptotermes secundus]
MVETASPSITGISFPATYTQQQNKQQEEGMAVTEADCCSGEGVAVGRRFCALKFKPSNVAPIYLEPHQEKTNVR